MDAETRRRARNRVRRVAGQVDGIGRMIEQDRYCVDVLMQIAAARAALDQLGKQVLGAHIESCVVEAFAGGDPAEREAKVQELLEVFSRFGSLRTR